MTSVWERSIERIQGNLSIPLCKFCLCELTDNEHTHPDFCSLFCEIQQEVERKKLKDEVVCMSCEEVVAIEDMRNHAAGHKFPVAKGPWEKVYGLFRHDKVDN